MSQFTHPQASRPRRPVACCTYTFSRRRCMADRDKISCDLYSMGSPLKDEAGPYLHVPLLRPRVQYTAALLPANSPKYTLALWHHRELDRVPPAEERNWLKKTLVMA